MASGVIKPKKLKIGDTIGIMAPSTWIHSEDADKAVATLKNMGMNVFLHPQALLQKGPSAGTVDQKIAALHELFADKDIAAIFSARGGVRGLHSLDRIDYDLIRQNPKIFTGFSDITAFHSALYTRAKLVTFHTQNVSQYKDSTNQTTQLTLDFLMGNAPNTLWSDSSQIQILKSGQASGVLFGGNLTMLATTLLAGNLYTPSLAGKILVIEEIDEEIRQIDRLLGALRLRGAFDEIVGLVFGYMTGTRDTGDAIRFDTTIQEIILEHTHAMRGPIILNAPFGHEDLNYPFPIGVEAGLTALENQSVELKLLESPFSDE
jgi:muramoyltetrapeptide carboxypeptidase